jgi:hypothetical protein
MGTKGDVDIRKIIQKQIRHRSEHADVAGDVNVVVSANVGGKPSRTHVSSHQRVVQRGTQSRAGGVDDRARGTDPG